MRWDRLPLSYDECRSRFRRASSAAGLAHESYSIRALGPQGQGLTIESAWIGQERPRRVLTVISGTHGVEGFIGSSLQCDLIGRTGVADIPGDTAIWIVHALNPWGMAWWRRQNESNVDLNRNWMRDETDPTQNDAYDDLHSYACPDTTDLPSVEDLMVQAMAVVQDRGLEYVRDGITAGQYRHPDGLHFGGDRTEESNLILQGLVTERLDGVEKLLTLDLHTGHGPRAAVTFLSDQPIGTDQDRFLRDVFGGERIMATADNPDATTGVKSGQIANGFGQLLAETIAISSSVEFGTAPDEEQLACTYLESWVHRHGDRQDPEHQEVIWRYRCCFTPDDAEWERACMDNGRQLLDTAIQAVCDWE